MVYKKDNQSFEDGQEMVGKVTLGSLSHVGMRRSNNQDFYAALARPNAPDEADAVVAVADGMGGHQAGEVASAMAIKGFVDRLLQESDENTTRPGVDDHDKYLVNIVKEINAEILEASKDPQTKGMGTTLTVAMLVHGKLVGVHVGDSRAYLLSNSDLVQITRDHTWVAEMVARGDLTEARALTHPKRNILTRAIGQQPDVDVDMFTVTVELGDSLLLCSDGLHGMVTDEEIRQTLIREEPQAACAALVDLANSRGGVDNITVVVIRYDGMVSRKDMDLFKDLETIKALGRPIKLDRKWRMIPAPWRFLNQIFRR